MEKDIKEYLTCFNSTLQNCQIEYNTNSFRGSFALVDLYLEVDDVDDPRKKVNTKLFMIVEELKAMAENVLVHEVNKFVNQCENEIKVLLPDMHFSLNRCSSLCWELTLIGSYDNNNFELNNLCFRLENDFSDCFEYARLNIN